MAAASTEIAGHSDQHALPRGVPSQCQGFARGGAHLHAAQHPARGAVAVVAARLVADGQQDALVGSAVDGLLQGIGRRVAAGEHGRRPGPVCGIRHHLGEPPAHGVEMGGERDVTVENEYRSDNHYRQDASGT